jgi:HK97 gp10 family phage protein
MGDTEKDDVKAECKIDFSGFEAKSTRVKFALSEAIKEALEFGMDELSRKVTANLSGIRHKPGTPSPYPGQIPVTKISVNLSQSVASKRIDLMHGVVYIRKDKAPYAKWVHWGTKRMKPRRFMTEAIADRKQAIINKQRYLVKLAIRKAGGGDTTKIFNF